MIFTISYEGKQLETDDFEQAAIHMETLHKEDIRFTLSTIDGFICKGCKDVIDEEQDECSRCNEIDIQLADLHSDFERSK